MIYTKNLWLPPYLFGAQELVNQVGENIVVLGVTDHHHMHVPANAETHTPALPVTLLLGLTRK